VLFVTTLKEKRELEEVGFKRWTSSAASGYVNPYASSPKFKKHIFL
jgi:hypothetical protein